MMSHAFLTEDDAGDNRFRPTDAQATARTVLLSNGSDGEQRDGPTKDLGSRKPK